MEQLENMPKINSTKVYPLKFYPPKFLGYNVMYKSFYLSINLWLIYEQERFKDDIF